MLTLTTEATNEKNKVATHAVLILKLTDLSLYYATEQYSLNTGSGTVTCYDRFARGGVRGWALRLPEEINRLSSVPELVVTLTDWRDEMRDDIIGTSPDLTDSGAEVYIKFDTSSNSLSNAVKVFTGKVKSYSVSHDRLTLRLRNTVVADFKPLPSTLLSTEYEVADVVRDDLVLPLQYGDFLWNTPPVFYADADAAGTLAICPYVYSDNDNHYFAVAGHTMKNMPTATQINSSPEGYLYFRRGPLLLLWSVSGATVTNTSAKAELAVPKSGTALAYLWVTETRTSTPDANTALNPENVMDGKTNTYATVNSTHTRLAVQEFDVDDVDKLNTTYQVKVLFYISRVSGTSPYGSLDVRKRTTGTSNTGSVSITSTSGSNGDGTGWYTYSTDLTISEINDYYATVGINTSDDEISVAAVVLQVKVNTFDPDSDRPVAYLRCQGRAFSGTWGGRKTSGDLIEKPVDVLESLLRDELGLSSELHTDSFDTVAATISSWRAHASLFRQAEAGALLADFCRAWGMALVFSAAGTVQLTRPTTGLKFSASDSTTPGDEDIYTDSETVSGGKYNRHPIRRGTFRLGRTRPPAVAQKVTVRYRRTFDAWLAETSDGGGQELVVNNQWLARTATADDLASVLLDWLAEQKWVVQFETFINALALEVGDVINVRHSDLNDDMLDATVNTQQWLVTEVAFRWRPQTVRVRAMELK